VEPPSNLFGMDLESLRAVTAALGEPEYRAPQV
jgi:hypothetical protein